LSGPTNASSMPAFFCAAGSSATSKLTTVMPAFRARATGPTIARLSAGAITITSYFWVMKFSTAAVCASKSVSDCMPTAFSSKSPRFFS